MFEFFFILSIHVVVSGKTRIWVTFILLFIISRRQTMSRFSSPTLRYVLCWILDIKQSMTKIILVLTANRAKSSLTSPGHPASPCQSLCGFWYDIFGLHFKCDSLQYATHRRLKQLLHKAERTWNKIRKYLSKIVVTVLKYLTNVSGRFTVIIPHDSYASLFIAMIGGESAGDEDHAFSWCYKKGNIYSLIMSPYLQICMQWIKASKVRTSGLSLSFCFHCQRVCANHSASFCLRFINPSRGMGIQQHTVIRIPDHNTPEVFLSQTDRP